ncbi:MAG TPA: hypothetical protein VMI72_06615 [Roseiarcus sp.]|nr:hypothetical protein [Roseiarcus sp.]
MFERLLARWRAEAANSLRMMAIAAACLLMAGATFGFLCAAAFIAALYAYGPVYACLVGAGVFFFATVCLLALYAALAARRRRIAEQEAARARAAAEAASPLADPRLILVGLQIVQAIGVRRLIPLLALGAAAFSLAARSGDGKRTARRSRRREESEQS